MKDKIKKTIVSIFSVCDRTESVYKHAAIYKHAVIFKSAANVWLVVSLAVISMLCVLPVDAADVIWYDGQHPIAVDVITKTDPVVSIALDLFQSDMKQVTSQSVTVNSPNSSSPIRLIQLNYTSAGQRKQLRSQGIPIDSIERYLDAFSIQVIDHQILVVGNNGRGTAYGLLELSRMAGVSPWIWWGDVIPKKKNRLTISDSYTTFQHPSVVYRGIFLNDEDWSLRPWSYLTYEPSQQFGHIGPKTYKKVFQLLLRLRANAIWPAMHTGSPGFFTIPGNKEMADSCGILIGSSHCEPLLRNNVDEWNEKERGAYNYITNRDQVQKYWIERLKQVKGSEELFTIGMRGIHDGAMEGLRGKSMTQQREALQQVIDDQRVLIGKYYDKQVDRVPQVFIPYKEVLQIYEDGLNVPDDVTLMWCDDNYGYMTRLSDRFQQQRKGGAGVYYHLSYWGRPHDYLWLNTTQPGLVYSEMKQAYDHQARQLWIVNVHDPKVAAYDLSLFLDMAWDINCVSPSTLTQHLHDWLAQQFGTAAANKLEPVMTEYFRLTAIRHPEFMGWTQVELDKTKVPRGKSQVYGTAFTEAFGNETERYLGDYAYLRHQVEEIAKSIRPELRDAYFAAIQYPVSCAADMAEKQLQSEKARNQFYGQCDASMDKRESRAEADAARSMAAYRDIQQLTRYYNETMANGKWKHSMSYIPRDLPVFFPPTLPILGENTQTSIPLTSQVRPMAPDSIGDTYLARNACWYDEWKSELPQDTTPVVQQFLGHSQQALALPKGVSVTYHFTTQKEGKANLYTALIPTQPNDKGDLRYSVSIDGAAPIVISLKEKYRSDGWKENVLRGQALKCTLITLSQGTHTLTIQALDSHIILDQWMVDFDLQRKFYVIPVESVRYFK